MHTVFNLKSIEILRDCILMLKYGMSMPDQEIFYNTLPNVVSNFMYHDIEFITGGFCITSRSYCACIKLHIHFLRHEKHFNFLQVNIPQKGVF